MPSFTNIGMLSQLKELIQQYVRSYVVTNSAGDAIYEVRNINPQEMSEAAKSLICLYEFSADPFPQGNTLCEECTNLFFRVAIRRMEREGSQYDTQVGYTRSIFAGQGVRLNKFSGTFRGTPFTNLILPDFGLYEFRSTPTQENYSKNDTWHTFGVSARVSFKNQIAA